MGIYNLGGSFESNVWTPANQLSFFFEILLSSPPIEWTMGPLRRAPHRPTMSSALALRGLHGPRGPHSCHRAHHARARVPRRQGPRRPQGDAPGPTRVHIPPASPCPRRGVVTRADGAATRDVSVKTNTSFLIIDPVVGAKRFSNYFWAGVVSIGATGLLLSPARLLVLEHNLLFFLDQSSEIKFFPQGLVMSFYGVAGCSPPTSGSPSTGLRSTPQRVRPRTRVHAPSSATALPARTGASTS